MEKYVRRCRVSGAIQAPSSKSYAQRALAAALLCEGESTLLNLEISGDTRAAIDTIEKLGAEVRPGEQPDSFVIRGAAVNGEVCPTDHTLNVGESGLAARLFTPIAALCGTPLTITGEGSLRERPLTMMEAPLKQLGVRVETNEGFLPIRVQGPLRGGETEVDGSLSSQFITGLLMALPMAGSDTTIRVRNLKSKPYIDMTLSIAEAFGIEIGHNEYQEFFVEGGQRYRPATYRIEGDWSGASCLLVAGAVAGEVTVENLNPISLQADVAMIDALSRAGAGIVTTDHSVTVRKRDLNAFEFDATDCPDLFPALVALASNCDGVSTIRGTSRLIHKESNRARTLAREFSKLGIRVDIEEEDVMRVRGGAISGGEVESHNDHRIAMAMAVAALNASSDVVIRGARAVGKSYPDFWDDFERLCKKK